MELSKDVYQALEDIVGPENISQEPATLDSYAFQLDSTLISRDMGHFMPRPVAAIMPGSTEEVQAIVKTCNRYKIKYKALSTGWAFASIAAPYEEGMIQLDLRRMDRILEIDEKNMFAVVEPYVIGATLQAEAMKLGLNTHLIGAGCACSPLASATSGCGPGGDTIFMGGSNQNLLALEWVMPTGEILRTGSLGAGCGWFCGEGPGLSTRGAFRGLEGASGGLGVFTKCALKLYPWPGPAVMPVEGAGAAYNWPIPENFNVYTVAFPSWDAYFDAHYKVFDAQIAYHCWKQCTYGEELQPSMVRILTDSTKHLDDLEELLKTPEIQKMTEHMRHSFQITLAGMTPRDIEYKEKALDEILAETGGWKVAEMSEPAMRRWWFLYLTRIPFKGLNYVWGGYIGAFVIGGSPDFAKYWYPVAMEMRRKFIEENPGVVADGGPDSLNCPVGSLADGGNSSGELFFQYDPHDPKSVKGTRELLDLTLKVAREKKLGGGLLEWHLGSHPKEEIQQALSSSPRPAIFEYQRKIKQALDPNNTGDTSWLYLEEPRE